jgi:hypothetical protein
VSKKRTRKGKDFGAKSQEDSSSFLASFLSQKKKEKRYRKSERTFPHKALKMQGNKQQAKTSFLSNAPPPQKREREKKKN